MNGNPLHPDGLRDADGAVWRVVVAPGGSFYDVTRNGEPVPRLGGTLDESLAGIRTHALGMEE